MMLTQMVDDWPSEIHDQKIVGAVLLDISVAFDVIIHSLMLEKLKFYGFVPPPILWKKSYLFK